MFKKLTLPGLLLLAALAFLAAPSQPLAASDCGENYGDQCSETKKCTGFWFWKKCKVTASSYYPGL
jgi:hypothetical protein